MQTKRFLSLCSILLFVVVTIISAWQPANAQTNFNCLGKRICKYPSYSGYQLNTEKDCTDYENYNALIQLNKSETMLTINEETGKSIVYIDNMKKDYEGDFQFTGSLGGNLFVSGYFIIRDGIVNSIMFSFMESEYQRCTAVYVVKNANTQ